MSADTRRRAPVRRHLQASSVPVETTKDESGPLPAQIAYATSKGAVLALTREMALIYARQNIRVNALCPDPLRTELLMKFLDKPQKQARRLVHTLPMGRFGEASEMAKAALFLASDDASFSIGQDFVVDGGITSAST